MNKKKINTATIELFTKCNFDCKHCYLPSKDINTLSLEQWIEIINILHLNKIKKIILTGGEPLLHRNFIEIYLYIFKLGIKISIFTNGSNFNRKLFALFKENKPESISITLYGINEFQYEYFTGMRSNIFDKVIKSIKKLNDIDILTFVGITPYKKISLDMLASFIKENKIYLNSYMMPCLDKKSHIEDRLSPQKMVELERLLDRKHDFTIPVLNNESELYTKKCGGGVNSIFIDPYGFASMCAINRQAKYSLLSDTFGAISAKLKNEHARIKLLYFSSPCGVCVHNSTCRNCPMYSELEGSIDGRNSYLCALLKERLR